MRLSATPRNSSSRRAYRKTYAQRDERLEEGGPFGAYSVDQREDRDAVDDEEEQLPVPGRLRVAGDFRKKIGDDEERGDERHRVRVRLESRRKMTLIVE